MAREREVRPCGDCGAKPGESHVPGCDVERCPFCGGQLISCGCCYKHFYPTYRHALIDEDGFCGLPKSVYLHGLPPKQAEEWDRVLKVKGLLPWTGIWPGVAECREFGWYTRRVEGTGWVQCEVDHPDASEDLNRLHRGETRWDADAKRWVLAVASATRRANPMPLVKPESELNTQIRLWDEKQNG